MVKSKKTTVLRFQRGEGGQRFPGGIQLFPGKGGMGAVQLLIPYKNQPDLTFFLNWPLN